MCKEEMDWINQNLNVETTNTWSTALNWNAYDSQYLRDMWLSTSTSFKEFLLERIALKLDIMTDIQAQLSYCVARGENGGLYVHGK